MKSAKGKSTATTVATIQTMRDAAHEVGEISDTVGKMTAELFEMNHFESLFLGPMMIEDFSP